VLIGGNQDDTIEGGAGDDWLSGDAGNDDLDAGAQNDILLGGSGTDGLLGSNGSDILVGGVGIDTLGGGLDDDTYIWRLGDGDDVISGETSGTDVLWIGDHGPADVILLKVNNDLRVKLPNATITITGYYGGINLIETIQTENP
jgi:Ca2+-binding RTX toxin-like protein